MSDPGSRSRTYLVIGIPLVIVLVYLALTTLDPGASPVPADRQAARSQQAPNPGLEATAEGPTAEGPTAEGPAVEGEVRRTPVDASPRSDGLGTLVILARFESGQGAPGYYLRVATSDGHGWSCVTDEAGSATLDNLPPGTVAVSTLRRAFGGTRVEIVADETATAEVTVPAGVDLSGRVVDAQTRGVPGATLEWVVDGTGREWAVPCGESDEEGRFRIRQVPERAYVGARFLGYTASLFIRVADAEGELVLVLQDPGGQIEGRVLGVDGNGVSGVRVVVATEHWDGRKFFSRSLPNNQRAVKEGFQVAETDARGRFVLGGVAVGPRVVVAEHVSKGCAVQHVEVQRGERANAVLTLAPPGTAVVRVVDDSGMGIRHLRMTLEHPGTRKYRTYTRKDGSCEFKGLLAGKARILLDHAGEVISRDIVIEAGNQTEATLRVPRGLQLEGVVVDERGAPYWGMRIEAISEQRGARDPWRGTKLTDQGGVFVIPHVPPAQRVRVLASNEGCYLAMRTNVDPAAGPVTLVVRQDEATIRKCVLRGRVQVPAGMDASKVHLQFLGRRAVRKSYILSPDESQAFEVEVPQDTYDLVMAGPELACQWLGPFRAEGTTSLDLGTLAAPRGGWIDFVVDKVVDKSGQVDKSEQSEVQGVEVFDGQGRRVARALVDKAGRGRTTTLRAGTYQVRGFGRHVTDMVSCRVTAGKAVELELSPLVGVPVRLSGRLAEHKGGMQRVRIIARESGRAVANWYIVSDLRGGWEVAGVLPVGDYDIAWQGEIDPGGVCRVSLSDERRDFDVSASSRK